MFLYDNVEINENNNYEDINLNIFAFNNQDLKRMINEVNVFVDNFSCENVLNQTSFRENRQIANSNIVLEYSNTIFAKSNIVLAELNIVFADSNIILAKLKIIFVESNVIVSKNEKIREDVFEIIFEKIVNEIFDEYSFE
jgi:23S rRNA-/tRNA-specific pseudouridylate synthase